MGEGGGERKTKDGLLCCCNTSVAALTGTSNQQFLEAKRNSRARARTLRLKLSNTKIFFRGAFFFLAVPSPCPDRRWQAVGQ